MRNSGLDEAQAGIKIARRNINNLRYADDTTLMAESEEELKSSGCFSPVPVWEVTLSRVVVQSLSHVWLCNQMDCSMPGFPVLHHLLEFAQTLVHWNSEAIQLSLPLSSPSLPAFNLSQQSGTFPLSLLSAIRVVSSANLRLLIFLPAILI